MIGKTILHYEISDKLGEGGMGVVYRAEDTKLKRDVAIKFPPRRYLSRSFGIAASDEERGRFKIEAQAAAALNHPNIATIHAIEEHDDEMFIMMEYIEGRELREVIAKPPEALSLRRAFDYATQIASGLQAAHEKGVTHRDIKSANIMITDKSQPGEPGAKSRSWIWDWPRCTAGCSSQRISPRLEPPPTCRRNKRAAKKLITEVISGLAGFFCTKCSPDNCRFAVDYEQAVIYSILNEEPEPVVDLLADVPEALRQILDKTLEKDRDARYQDTEVLLADLNPVSWQSSRVTANRVRQPPGRLT